VRLVGYLKSVGENILNKIHYKYRSAFVDYLYTNSVNVFKRFRD